MLVVSHYIMRNVIKIFFLIFSLQTYSQDSTKERLPLFIKTNLSYYVTGVAYFSVEKAFHKIHPEIGAGLIYPFKPWMNALTDNSIVRDENAKYYYGHGYIFSIQSKFIVEEEPRKSKSYISTMLMYRHVWKNNIWVTYRAINGYPEDPPIYVDRLTSDKTNVYAFEILFGSEIYIKKLVQLDFYTGFGLRDVDHITNVSVDDPWLYNKIKFTWHLGLNVGINIFKNKYSG
jgi:hypothetical protein